MQRDCSRRGYTSDQVLEELDRRGPDSEAYIRPQQRWADIVVSFMPGDGGDQDHLDARLTLRDGLGHPDLSALIDGDAGGMRLQRGRATSATCGSRATSTPRAAAEVEEAIWDRMHFASHLRSERLGEFTIATELHRSESLAIVQVLVLYHLVTARASVALGGAGSRVDREPVDAPEPRSASALEQHPHERAGEGDLPEGRRGAEVGRAQQRRDRGDDHEDREQEEDPRMTP